MYDSRYVLYAAYEIQLTQRNATQELKPPPPWTKLHRVPKNM